MRPRKREWEPSATILRCGVKFQAEASMDAEVMNPTLCWE